MYFNDNPNREMLRFIDASPTPFHAVENMKNILLAEGYTQLEETACWDITAPGKYFVTRSGSALIAFRVPKADFRGFMICAAHTDSPCFKIKENSAVKQGGYSMLNIEKYGGMLCSTWTDKPLSAAGRIVVRENGRIAEKLVNIDRNLAVIPNVAIHMDREQNDGKKYNVNVDMLPIIGIAGESLEKEIEKASGVASEDILSRELSLYPRTPGIIWGGENELISSPRLDDLQCVWTALTALIDARDSESTAVFCAFDNEEVGSGTKQGADSDFLADVLMRICESFDLDRMHASAKLANSFMVSADNAHAVHPNHPEYADRNDRPAINGGIVIKYDASGRYTTDSLSAAIFGEICKRAGVPVQVFTNRADKPGGSTLGHISAAHVSVPSVDIGAAQLAMHSAWETAGAKDTEYFVRGLCEFFSSSLKKSAQGYEI